MSTKTERFASELKTATYVQHIAQCRGYQMTVEQAHEAWTEHSDDYCASWLSPDSETPAIEALHALIKWRERHSK